MEIDKDGSGGIDIFEFTELINILSLNMDKEEIEEVNIATTLLFLFLLLLFGMLLIGCCC